MSLKVEIVSSETIRPSSPPPHKTHKLSCLDQLSPPRYIPVLYSYTGKQFPPRNDTVEKLKSSLSTILNHYYPLAGRYSPDGLSIECNGEGVPFTVSKVANDMLPAVADPDEASLGQLFPCPPQNQIKDGSGKLLLLAVQVNMFKCGGIAVGICAWHRVADASTITCFAQCWAAICRGDTTVHGFLPQAVVDYASLFPSLLSNIPIPSESDDVDPGSRVVVKRFVFPANKIALLRRNISVNHRQLTRVEAISSLAWAATIRSAQEKRKEKGSVLELGDGFHSATMVVNLRTRTSPPLPAVCMGNLIQVTETVKWPINREVTEERMGELATKLRGVVRAINPEYIASLHQNGSLGYLNLVKSCHQEQQKEDFLMISSSCRYPIYETDFGWGKAVSVHGFSRRNKIVVLLDASDGEGIEAWVTLDKDDMSRFVKDPDILYYSL